MVVERSWVWRLVRDVSQPAGAARRDAETQRGQQFSHVKVPLVLLLGVGCVRPQVPQRSVHVPDAP